MRLKFWKNKLLVGALIGLFVAILASVLFYLRFPLLERWQWSVSDLFFQPTGPGKQIIIVGVDEKSLDKQGRWPWPRDMQAKLLTTISKGKPSVIGWDLACSEPSKTDARLAAAIKQARNIVLPEMAIGLTSTKGVPEAQAMRTPKGKLKQPKSNLGHANVTPDSDSVVRKFPPLIKSGGNWHEAFSLQVVRKYKNLPASKAPVDLAKENLGFGSIQIPLDQQGYTLINYATEPLVTGKQLTFPYVSCTDVLNGKVDPVIFKNKIVLIGITAIALGDSIQTPVSAQSMYGIEIHASIINTILNQNYLTEQGRGTTIAMILFLGLLAGLLLPQLRPLRATLFALSLVVLYVLIAASMHAKGVIFNLIYPPLTVFWVYAGSNIYHRTLKEMEKTKVTSLFGRYLKPEIVQQIIADADENLGNLRGVRQEVTILFADIRGFTSMSENMEPEQVVAMLNKHLTRITDINFKHDGTLDKYIGDCVMTFYNAPHPQQDHALRAVKAAIEMQAESKIEQSESELEDDLPPVKCGIGIHTGEAIIGNIGNPRRLDYTAIGDAVNTASRLCGIAGPGQILISSGTYELVKNEINAENLGPMKFKGKKREVIVYEVQGLR